jgi:hypothetical protein
MNLKLHRIYKYGFSHANCGGLCVGGGLKYYALLYTVWSQRYKVTKLIDSKINIWILEVYCCIYNLLIKITNSIKYIIIGKI